ncbi:MAG TPA: ParB/RepB/Spo0J family partition protein [Stellaceae bacterium]|jgi:ParB family chromosome partitioning protein|nr:ParB/RepB/Spo0J family partition protein [Stellaceae bacterium]
MIEDTRRRTLGRGLSALLGEEDAAPEAAPRTIRIDLLRPGRYQPRHQFDTAGIEALAQSIREKGVLQPLLVRRHPGLADAFEIVAGERRWRAAQLAQLHEVPVVLREIDDREALEIALVENLQRQDLSALDEATAYQRLLDEFSHTQEAVAQAVGKSRSHVANTLRLLDLPAAVKQLLEEGQLSAGHARALLGASDPQGLAQEVVRRGLNVRQVERLAKRSRAKPSQRTAPSKDADTRAVERDLSMALGLAVSISPAGTGGTLGIRYQTLDQLEDLIHRLRYAPTLKY